MTRLNAAVGIALTTLAVAACAAGLGGPRAIDTPTVAVRADAGADAGAVAAALNDVGPRAAFVIAPMDAAWFRAVAEASGRHLSGPAEADGLRMAFLAAEPLGDTTVTLPYDGGSLTVQDALYEMGDERYLDLMAFRIAGPEQARPALTTLLEYVATDVSNAAAVVMAVAVPDPATADSVARMLSPAYFDAARCGGADPARWRGSRLRLYYGPEARMYCTDASVGQLDVGTWIEADLVMGRR